MTSDFISMFDEFNDATFNVFMAVVCSLGDIALLLLSVHQIIRNEKKQNIHQKCQKKNSSNCIFPEQFTVFWNSTVNS